MGAAALTAVRNRTIFTADNLHVMRGMRSESVDLIYLDPPFNSKHNYAAPIGSRATGAEFKDVWTLDDVDLAWWGEIADTHPGLYKVLETARETAGKSMMSYLIYMAVRMIEMHRVLKPTGSLYLHCDTTASHYLKLVLDAIFGFKSFRNDVTWKRFSSHNDGKRYGKISDQILFYTKTGAYTWNQGYAPYSEEYVKQNFTEVDAKGRYQHRQLTAESLAGGGYEYEYHGHTRTWKRSPESMEKLEREGRVHFPKRKGGIPRYKIYLSEAKGTPLQNIWTDIPHVQGGERIGYPTQKPIALLERIIEASSNEGDVVLDPFCGCATACSAAEKLNRKWIGIDVSPKAYELVKERLAREAGLDKFTKGAGEVIHRVDVPSRKGRRTACYKDVLYGRQEGNCKGCCHHFEYRHLELDHVVPKAKGGPDTDENLQLLCSSCNRIKGPGRDMAGLKARMKEMGLSTC